MLSLVLPFLARGAAAADSSLPPHGLRVDHLNVGAAEAALGVSLSPTLSWRLTGAVDEQAGGRGLSQAAFEVNVVEASIPNAVVWSSGKMASSVPEVRIPDAVLHPNAQYDWRVRVWLVQARKHSNSIYAMADSLTHDSASSPSRWSDYQRFGTSAAEVFGSAAWIGGGNMFRTDLNVPTGKQIKSARAYVSALGAFDLVS